MSSSNSVAGPCSDAPGSLGAGMPVVNDLDLEVEGPGGLFLGNVFDVVAGESMVGGAADPVVPAHLFNGSYNGIIIDGITTNGFGAFSGFFSQPGATSDPTFPGGVGLTYSINDGSTTTVSGAAAFGNP